MMSSVSLWQSIHQSYVMFLQSKRSVPLATGSEPSELARLLASQQLSLADRDHRMAELLKTRGTPQWTTAQAVMFLACFPGLSRVYRRATRQGGHDDAAGEIHQLFLQHLDRWNLDKTDHVAVNLVLGVWRDWLRARQRTAADDSRTRQLCADAELQLPPELRFEASAADAWAAESSSDEPFEPGHPEVDLLRNKLQAQGLPDDLVELLILRDICACPWEQLELRFNAPRRTLQKRRERALGQLRQHGFRR